MDAVTPEGLSGPLRCGLYNLVARLFQSLWGATALGLPLATGTLTNLTLLRRYSSRGVFDYTRTVDLLGPLKWLCLVYYVLLLLLLPA